MGQPSKKISPKATRRNEKAAQRSLNPAVRFVLLFLLLVTILGLLYAHLTASYHEKIAWIMDLTAVLSSWVVSILPGESYRLGTVCSYNGFSVEIIDECTGLLEMVIYSAAVLAFSTSIRNKLIGLAIGVPAIFLFNLIRIVVLLLVGAYSHSLFEFMHLYFWQATLIIMIASVWIGWLYLVVFREKRSLAVSN